MQGFQKPQTSVTKREVGLARISYDGMTVHCSCKWSFVHYREKVRENAIDRHLRKRHHGRGIRL